MTTNISGSSNPIVAPTAGPTAAPAVAHTSAAAPPVTAPKLAGDAAAGLHGQAALDGATFTSADGSALLDEARKVVAGANGQDSGLTAVDALHAQQLAKKILGLVAKGGSGLNAVDALKLMRLANMVLREVAGIKVSPAEAEAQLTEAQHVVQTALNSTDGTGLSDGDKLVMDDITSRMGNAAMGSDDHTLSSVDALKLGQLAHKVLSAVAGIGLPPGVRPTVTALDALYLLRASRNVLSVVAGLGLTAEQALESSSEAMKLDFGTLG